MHKSSLINLPEGSWKSNFFKVYTPKERFFADFNKCFWENQLFNLRIDKCLFCNSDSVEHSDLLRNVHYTGFIQFRSQYLNTSFTSDY